MEGRKSFTFYGGFDAHLHLRDGEMLARVLKYSTRQFVAAIIMPNLSPPVVTAEQVLAYRNRILSTPRVGNFVPYMTTYLTENTDPADIRQGYDAGIFVAAKLYPLHGTTNSAHGVVKLEKIFPTLEVMEEIGMKLLLHGEMPPSSGVDIFDREKVFIDKKLSVILKRYPKLRIVMEHITTSEACAIVRVVDNVYGTITPQHLLYDRNALFDGGLHPHLYCMPILKRSTHTQAIQNLVLSGSKKAGLGTDSAPHMNDQKYKDCGCAGVFSAPVAIESYFEFFHANDAVDKFQAFISGTMADFYGLTLPKTELIINEIEGGWEVPNESEGITPFEAGKRLKWKASLTKR